MGWDGRIAVDPKAIARQDGARVIADGDLAAHGLSGIFDIEDDIPTTVDMDAGRLKRASRNRWREAIERLAYREASTE
ncbi:hypothetical protein [Methylococcus geothermalis]|uniref:Uncharacterized protein n=1 Tax=Methylococcus geothermalis TaxID=2681310 RepID=A0A858Q543_9GAMM|nr:hypothetical protein [Methylococcus geothermalis]QJD28856.1 hypothetical protein GNH96_02005 [Methylococcus geothermalis]